MLLFVAATSRWQCPSQLTVDYISRTSMPVYYTTSMWGKLDNNSKQDNLILMQLQGLVAGQHQLMFATL